MRGRYEGPDVLHLHPSPPLEDKGGLVRGCSCRGTSGFVHLSCLAEQAKILREEAEENNLGLKVKNKRWDRWHTCSLCEQRYHGLVRCALGWACWKTYVGRLEEDWARRLAMNLLGVGLCDSGHDEEALSVQEAELTMKRRLGGSEENILAAQSNLACTYQNLGRSEEALRLKRDVYFGQLKLKGEERVETIGAGHNYANSLLDLKRPEEAKSLMRKLMPVARRVLGEGHNLTLMMRWVYAQSLFRDDAATLDDLRKAVTTLEEIERIARRVFGGTHPTTAGIVGDTRRARAALRAREETPSGGA